MQIKAGAYVFHSPEWDSVSPDARGLIDRMLTVDQERRITAEAALAHPWVGRRDATAPTLHRPVTLDCMKMLNARRKFKGAVIAALVGRSRRLSATTPPAMEKGNTIVRPLRLSYFKGLRRLGDQDMKQQKPNTEERPRQKSPNNQKDRANFVDIKFKLFK